MSPENIGKQFEDHVLVHRGIPCVGPECVTHGNLGIHWSKKFSVADRFADWNEDADDEHSPEEDQGVVVSALVHKKDIIKPYSEEWHKLQRGLGNQIFNEDHDEKERTIRSGAKVHVVSIEHNDSRGKMPWDATITKTTHNPPLESTA